jgi:hypothetical protein
MMEKENLLDRLIEEEKEKIEEELNKPLLTRLFEYFTKPKYPTFPWQQNQPIAR